MQTPFVARSRRVQQQTLGSMLACRPELHRVEWLHTLQEAQRVGASMSNYGDVSHEVAQHWAKLEAAASEAHQRMLEVEEMLIA